MRIKFVSQYFYPEPFSNVHIVNGLLADGHSLDVMTGVPNYGKQEFYEGYSNRKRREDNWNGVPIKRVWSFPRGKSSASLIVNYFVFALMGSLEGVKSKKGDFDLVFVSLLSPIFMAIPAIVIARRLNIPLVYWLQDLWPESATNSLNIKSKWIIRPLNWICSWIYKKADIILVQSEEFPRYLAAHGVNIDKTKFFPNTAPEIFKPISRINASRPDFLPTSGFNLMFAGNIGDGQGLDNIVETADLLKDAIDINWILVGSGRALEGLKEKVNSRGLASKFTFAGRHPENDMPDFYAHADAMLVTLRDYPIFSLTVPYKIHTYLACGRPIVAALNGEGARIINEANAGVTAPAEDHIQLAAAIREIATLKASDREILGVNGYNYFKENYSSEVVFNNLKKWLKEIEDGELRNHPSNFSSICPFS